MIEYTNEMQTAVRRLLGEFEGHTTEVFRPQPGVVVVVEFRAAKRYVRVSLDKYSTDDCVIDVVVQRSFSDPSRVAWEVVAGLSSQRLDTSEAVVFAQVYTLAAIIAVDLTN